MLSLGKFKALQDEFHNVADFLVIYIDEAHMIERFNLSGIPYVSNEPKTIEDRISRTKVLVEDMKLQCPVLVDGMWNEASMKYGAWPDRLCVILNGNIAFLGGEGPFHYDMEDVRTWLYVFASRNNL